MNFIKKLSYIGYLFFLPLILLLSCHQREDIAQPTEEAIAQVYSLQEIVSLKASSPIRCGRRYPFPVFHNINLVSCNTRGPLSVVDVGTVDGDADVYYYVLEIKTTSGDQCYSVAKYSPSIKLVTGEAYGIIEYRVTRYAGYGRHGSRVRWIKSNTFLINC